LQIGARRKKFPPLPARNRDIECRVRVERLEGVMERAGRVARSNRVPPLGTVDG